MKRRDFLVGATGIVATFPVARIALGEVPCPPTLGVEGGVAGTAIPCGDPATLPVGNLIQEAQTPEQMALFLPVTGSLASDSFATVRYRLSGSGGWNIAHPLLRLDSSAPEQGFAGSIFDLEAGAVYDVEVHVTDPAKGTQVIAETFRTRVLPRPSGNATVSASPGDNLQPIIDGLRPGDVLELGSGTHILSSSITVGVSGEEGNPIHIRGANRTGTLLDATSGAQIQVSGNHLVFEDFSFEGGGSSGQRVFVLSSNREFVRDITIRGIRSANTGRAVHTAGGTSGSNAHEILVYNNQFLGIAPWTAESISTSTYWSNDGIRLVGTGNCVWNNTLQGFGDSITFAHSVDDLSIKACFAYRNFIRNSVDDCFEFDYAVRNCAAYDNYCENIRPLMSMDPVRGGPVYCFRNIAVNIATRPFKFNSSGTGYLIYNNTMLRSETYQTGDANADSQAGFGRGWGKLNATNVNRIAYRNNILIYTGGNSSKEIYRLRNVAAGANDGTIDWSNNAHFPDIKIVWEGDAGTSAFSKLSEAQSGIRSTLPLFPAGAGLAAPLKRHENDLVTVANPFSSSLSMGADAGTEVSGQKLPLLESGSPVRNSGVPIPGITDGYSGSAPDRGALIAGRTVPTWGAQ